MCLFDLYVFMCLFTYASAAKRTSATGDTLKGKVRILITEMAMLLCGDAGGLQIFCIEESDRLCGGGTQLDKEDHP